MHPRFGQGRTQSPTQNVRNLTLTGDYLGLHRRLVSFQKVTGSLGLTFEAEYVDAEYIDAEYARYVNAAGGAGSKKLGWTFWVALAALAMVIYTAAFVLQAKHTTPAAAVPNMDFHDCTLPEVKVEFARPNSGQHDVIAPYAHSMCKEGDVRLWEATQ